MDRRCFLATGLTVSLGAISVNSGVSRAQEGADLGGEGRFKLKYAPHFGMFGKLVKSAYRYCDNF